MHKIIVNDSHGNEYSYPLRETEGTVVSIGRRMTNDIVLGKATVSRHHATITVEGNGRVVVDVHSSNGIVFGNETVYRQVVLRDRDEFFIDHYGLRYEVAHDTQPMDPVLATPSVLHDGRVTDHRLLDALHDRALVGHRFCFFDRPALFGNLPAWMRSFVPDADDSGTLVIPLFGETSIEIPGAIVTPPRFADVRLRSLTSDRALYRELEDVVELLVYTPGADREGRLLLSRNGVEFDTHHYRTDPFGVARVSIEDLPTGTYAIRFDDSDPDEPPCEFSVATFQLAGLTATLRDRRLDDDTLHIELGLQSYGATVDGPVRLALLSDGRRVDEGVFDALDGQVSASLEARGPGPFDIEVQLVEDASRTATVRIVGTRMAEREETLVSAMDRERFAALVPREGAREVRGLWVTDAGHRVSLFDLEDIEANPARLTARTDIEQAAVVLLAPGEPVRNIGARSLEEGEVWEIPLPAGVNTAVVAIGAITADGRAWEGWSLVSSPPGAKPEVVVGDDARPGETVEIGVRAEGMETGVAYFVVKDQRLVTPDTVENRLAGAIKRWADEADTLLGAGFVDTALADAFPETTEHQAYLIASHQQAPAPAWDFAEGAQFNSYRPPPSSYDDGPISLRQAGQIDGYAAPGASPERPPERPPESGEADDDVATTTTEEATVFFVGIARIAGGEASVEVELPDRFADVLVEVFVASHDEWASAETIFRVERTPYAAVEVPRFVYRSDTARGIVTLFSDGPMEVTAMRDGEAIDLRGSDGTVVEGELDDSRVELNFDVTPGAYVITVEDLESGEVHTAEKIVAEPGKLRGVARTLRFLEPGDVVGIDEVGTLKLRLLPALEQPFELLCDATADYQHLCIEQTSAKIVSACAMYVFSGDDDGRRARAKRIISAGVRRVESMYLPGRGFKTYPTSIDRPDRHWGVMATGYLRFMRVVETDDAGLQSTLSDGLTMATDAGHAYDLRFPPRDANTPQDVYLLARFAESAADRETALDAARRSAATAPSSEASGRVVVRMDKAWTAATLFRAGNGSDFELGLKLANDVVDELNPHGRLYSTSDSVAAIALMAELRDADVIGARGEVDVDGRKLPTTEAMAVEGPRRIACESGRAIVEITRVVEENWETFRADADVRVSIERDGQPCSTLEVGSSAELVVELLDGYEAGDVLWVCLPPALSRIEGGGQVKLFSVDFAERTSLRVPLAATAATDGGEQHFMICVRNMFNEERTGNPGALAVRVG